VKREQFDIRLKNWSSKRETLGKNPHEELAEFFSYQVVEQIIGDGSTEGTREMASMLLNGVKGYKDYTMKELADHFYLTYCEFEGKWFLKRLVEIYPI
jgi:hypothetical protein